MKRYLLLLLAITFVQCTTPRGEINKHWKNYANAMTNGDIATAIVEANAIYTIDTTNQAVLDTLSRLYFISGNSFGAFQTTRKLTERNHAQRLILAESAYQIGNRSAAKQYFSEANSADTTSNNIGLKYKLATLHFDDKEYQEAIHLLNEVIQNERSQKVSTRTNHAEGQFQDVSLFAASYNFAGYIQLLNGQFEIAENYFNTALIAQPDFILAKNNLAQLAKEKAK